jgi:hypothetical protein
MHIIGQIGYSELQNSRGNKIHMRSPILFPLFLQKIRWGIRLALHEAHLPVCTSHPSGMPEILIEKNVRAASIVIKRGGSGIYGVFVRQLALIMPAKADCTPQHCCQNAAALHIHRSCEGKYQHDMHAVPHTTRDPK